MASKQMPPFAGEGTHIWDLHIKSDCYRGVDVIKPIRFEVLSEVAKEIYIHPDDADLDS